MSGWLRTVLIVLVSGTSCVAWNGSLGHSFLSAGLVIVAVELVGWHVRCEIREHDKELQRQQHEEI